jgi:hypothetical protein
MDGVSRSRCIRASMWVTFYVERPTVKVKARQFGGEEAR